MSQTLASPLSALDRWKAWDAFLETTPDAGFMQSSWWADFRATCGFSHFGATLKHRGAVVGGALVLKFCYAPGRCFYYIPEGPVLPDDEPVAREVFEAMLEVIAERRESEPETVSHLRIEPRWTRLPGFVEGFRAVPEFRDCYMEPRGTACVDLRDTEEAILARMKPKGRYNIGVARKHGVTVVEDASEHGLSDFLTIYGTTTERQRIGKKPADYFETLVSLLSSLGRGSVFFAEREGARLAAAIVVYFGRRATYFYGGSLDTDRHVMAPYLLHFEIMRKAKALGHDWYDLWGVAPENAPDHPWAGISVFKRKFGGEEVRLVPTHDLVYDEAAYERFVADEGRS